jgi:hypothetical protein
MVLLLAIFSLVGCGPNCRQSCERLYGDGDGQCNINVIGAEGDAGANELIQDCLATCESAMATTGPVGTYDPNSNDDNEATIQNEKQAALWMDCVEGSSCETLGKGYCQPHL